LHLSPKEGAPMLNTIGYEGADLSDFIETLKLANIQTVIDIRDRAQSRRPGFSKSALSKLLSESGISYQHYRELGDPKEGREAARANDLSRFKAIFSKVLESDAAQAALKKVIDVAESEVVCLLCYERDETHCHRKLVADKIETMTGNKARHLGVRRFESDRKRA
jgi:uncharacterized protein (DUF488 family)